MALNFETKPFAAVHTYKLKISYRTHSALSPSASKYNEHDEGEMSGHE